MVLLLHTVLTDLGTILKYIFKTGVGINYYTAPSLCKNMFAGTLMLGLASRSKHTIYGHQCSITYSRGAA
jgi:hypothetical protein